MIITAKSPPRPHRRAARNTSVAALEFFIPQEDCGAQSERELLRELLRYGCGYSARETAALMDMSYGAGQKLQQRAKAALRQELEKEGLTV